MAPQGGDCICQSRPPPIEPKKLVIARGLGNCIGTREYRDVPCGHNHGDKWTVLIGNLSVCNRCQPYNTAPVD